MRLIQLERLARQVQKKIEDWRGTSGQIYFVHRVDQYRQIWRDVAAALDAELVELEPDLWEVQKDGRRTRINNYLLQLDDPVTLELAGRKPLVHSLLKAEGLPVPEHAVFDLASLDVAERFVAAHPLGAVIKPADGYGGKGVTTHLREPKAVRDAAILASLYSQNLLVEAQILGECFRLLVFDDEVISVVRRTGLRVTGDGVSDLATLVRRRGLEVDADCRFTLAAQGLSPSTVPDADQVVLAKGNGGEGRAAELRTVYDRDVTAEVHETVRRAAEGAARAVGSRFLGVDVITPDITRPLEEVGGSINEVNTTPALHHHYDAQTEAYPEVARTILARLLAPEGGAAA